MLNCPYTELEMLTSVLNIPELSEDNAKKLREALNELLPKDLAERHQACAEFHGIGKHEYLNSPNMKTLYEMYVDHKVMDLMLILKNMGLSDKQAWFLICKMAKGSESFI